MGDEDKDKEKAGWEAADELADFNNDIDIASVIRQAAVTVSSLSSRSSSSNDHNHSKSNNPLLDVAAALIEKDRVCSTTGLARALRELSCTIPPPTDPSTWLASKLREYRPVPTTIVAYEESVLDGLVMKCDEFANVHLLSTARLHPDTWNFRKCDDEDLSVFGVGQCHLDGIQFLLEHLQDDLRFDTVKWFNMREEPVVFLNGQACAPRVKGQINDNVEYLVGIEGYELDSMELRLCSDCVDTARNSLNENKTLGVFYQTENGSNEERQLTILESEKTVSVRNGYQWLTEQQQQQEGNNVPITIEYYRIPISDETAPEEKDFDQLIAELKGCIGHPGVALVFNCQMGRGRTTTGMVSACILSKAVQRCAAASTVLDIATTTTGKKGVRPSFLQQIKLMKAQLAGTNNSNSNRNNNKQQQRNKKRGEFVSILTLMEMIDSTCECTGRQAKELADACIDSCAHAQNMVEAIEEAASHVGTASERGSTRSPEFWHARAHNYLERYAYIVLFAAYALESAPSKFRRNFSEWNRQYWHFKRIIKDLTLD